MQKRLAVVIVEYAQYRETDCCAGRFPCMSRKNFEKSWMTAIFAMPPQEPGFLSSDGEPVFLSEKLLKDYPVGSMNRKNPLYNLNMELKLICRAKKIYGEATLK